MDIYNILKTLDTLNEGANTMKSAAKAPTGPKFTGYWKGTDKRTPGNKMVGGGCEESVENEIREGWEQYLKEYGMTTGGMMISAANNPVEQQKAAKEINQTQQNINKIKSATGTNPGGLSQATAAKAAVNTMSDPKLQNPAGQGMDSNTKKTAIGLGQEMEKLLTTGNSNQVQQVANALKQAKVGK
jgi:hypothetical protein